MTAAPEFHAYGSPHLLVIFLTAVLPFALFALVRRSKSQRAERVLVVTLSGLLVVNYATYLIFVRYRGGAVSWQQLLPLQLCDWGMVVVIVAMFADEVTCYSYGCLLHKPEAFSILNFLSDSRPLYLLQMHGVALLFFLVLYAPFGIVDLAERKLIRKAGKQEKSG